MGGVKPDFRPVWSGLLTNPLFRLQGLLLVRLLSGQLDTAGRDSGRVSTPCSNAQNAEVIGTHRGA